MGQNGTHGATSERARALPARTWIPRTHKKAMSRGALETPASEGSEPSDASAAALAMHMCAFVMYACVNPTPTPCMRACMHTFACFPPCVHAQVSSILSGLMGRLAKYAAAEPAAAARLTAMDAFGRFRGVVEQVR